MESDQSSESAPVPAEKLNQKPDDGGYATISSNQKPRFTRPGFAEGFDKGFNRARATVSRQKWGRKTILLVVAFLLVGFGSGFLGGLVGRNTDEASSILGTNSAISNGTKIITSQSQLINQIAKSVGQSVVSVNVTGTTTSSSTGFFDYQPSQTVESAGTGIIISSDGLILTNRHVVPSGTTKVSVTLADGTELSDVSVVGRTSDSDSLDVAFLKVNDTKGEKLVPAAIGDSSKVQVGDSVVAIGNALGQFQNTVTAGIISGYGRSVQASDSSGTQASESLDNLFQTDAAINEGNSGGPLVNSSGQVIGINTAIAGNAQDIGFAIPINDVSGLLKQVMATGKLERPYLGVRYIPLTADYAYQYNLSVNQGAYVAPSTDGTSSVISGSPADKAGIQEKDIITEVNGTKIDEQHSLTSLLNQHQVGDTISLKVIRDDKTIDLKATLEAAPTTDSSTQQ